ncbi:ATP-binding protein [Xanthomonas sp. 4461]|uniref:AAA family ATPase n=1 Tax=Xanthomonas sp. 4461 TaxID=3035313 RepID=UPI00216A7FBF|nr:ATP-binding protein [Xanthomonas sp. 4461]MCS3809664.1 putative ATPase [Xanthomonas sp. 4461]
MKPTTVLVQNFRSIEESVFSIRNGLNVLVGPNGAGKSNVLQSLRFLSSLLHDGGAVALGKAGGPARNFRRGSTEISFIVVTEYETTLYEGKQTAFWLQWHVKLSLTQGDNVLQISGESLSVFPSSKGKPVIHMEVVRNSTGALKFKADEIMSSNLTKKMVASQNVSNKSEQFKIANKNISEAFSSMKKRPSDASFLPHFSWLHDSIRRLLTEIGSFDEYNIQPDVARLAVDPLPFTRMGNDGKAVSEVINALESHQYHRLMNNAYGGGYYGFKSNFGFGWGNYYSINSLTKSNPLEKIIEHLSAAVSSIDGLCTELDPSTGRRFVVFKSGANRFRPEEISDGTMKWLCLLVAIYVPQSKVILLEEPENFMHPWMQQRFVSILREQGKKLNTAVIMTTHSATILNALMVSELLLVRHEGGATSVQNVEDVDQVQAVLNKTNFGLGDMWVSGAIGAVAGEN